LQCWACGGAADGGCRFCGRGVCKGHARTRAYLFEAWSDRDELRGLVVEDALHCGVCRVQADPIALDFLLKATNGIKKGKK
jgi:hypothetical protein